MLKNLFDNNNDIIFKKPNQELLDSINNYNKKVDKIEKNAKIFAAIFVAIMAVLWISGDLAGFNSNLVLIFGLLTIFGYPIIASLSIILLITPSMKNSADNMAFDAINEMNVPESAIEIELLHPVDIQNKDIDSISNFEKNSYLLYADSEALYIGDITGVAKIPYHSLTPWRDAGKKAVVRSRIRLYKSSDLKKYSIVKKSSIFSLLPFGSFIPDKYLIPYKYSVVRTQSDDYIICVPTYEFEKVNSVIKKR